MRMTSQTGSWAKWLGNAAGVVVSAAVLALPFVHEGVDRWTQSMDLAIFGNSNNRYHPTIGLCAVAAALVAAGIGYGVGAVLDRQHRP